MLCGSVYYVNAKAYDAGENCVCWYGRYIRDMVAAVPIFCRCKQIHIHTGRCFVSVVQFLSLLHHQIAESFSDNAGAINKVKTIEPQSSWKN
jgi:hypothetical protein